MPRGKFKLNASATGNVNPGYTSSSNPDLPSERKPKAPGPPSERSNQVTGAVSAPNVTYDGGVSKVKVHGSDSNMKGKAPTVQRTPSGRYILGSKPYGSSEQKPPSTIDKNNSMEKAIDGSNKDWVVPPSYSTETTAKLTQSVEALHRQESSTEEKGSILDLKAKEDGEDGYHTVKGDDGIKYEVQDDGPDEVKDDVQDKVKDEVKDVQSDKQSLSNEDSRRSSIADSEQTTVTVLPLNRHRASKPDDTQELSQNREQPRVILRIRNGEITGRRNGSVGNGSIHSNHTGSENGSIARSKSDSESEVKLDNLQADIVKELTVSHDDLGSFVRTPSGRRVTFDKSRILYTTSKSGSNIIIDALPSDTESEVSGNRSYGNGSIGDAEDLPYDLRHRQWRTMDWEVSSKKKNKQKSCPMWVLCTVIIIAVIGLGVLGALYGLQYVSTSKGEISLLESTFGLVPTESGTLFARASEGPANYTQGEEYLILVKGSEVMTWRTPSDDVTMVWHRGSHLELVTLTPYGPSRTVLGDPIEESGAVYSVTITASSTQWTAANLVNPFSYSLIGLCAGEQPLWSTANSTELTRNYPNRKATIEKYSVDQWSINSES